MARLGGFGNPAWISQNSLGMKIHYERQNLLQMGTETAGSNSTARSFSPVAGVCVGKAKGGRRTAVVVPRWEALHSGGAGMTSGGQSVMLS